MHPVIYLNKTMVEATKARVAPVSSAMLYGRGVFTTLAIYNSQPFLWSKHWQRLAAHAKKLDIDHTGCTEKNVGEALHKLIAVNQVREGRARVILLARSGRDIWKTKTPGAKKTDLLIMTGEPQKLAPTGMSLAVSPFRTNTSSPLTGIKSLNYLEHVLAWEEAQSRDFDEAVVLNERGEIVSATTANLFWAKNGTLHTPTLSTGTLAGITRECVIELASQHFIPLLEGIYEMPDLIDADEIFLTSSTLGVAPVTTFDFRRYSAAGTITTTIKSAFLSVLSASN
ncbi:MAG TPA: aminotransferase class IV [Pyrinomonadaceae bacterium]|jgi:aminodeoxychorismate lyase|nr:aminotransferase class IV [Pyrinomonadaceae bacterium]